MAAIFLFVIFYRPAAGLEADFLDVGQGDSELVKAPAGQNVLIDGGPDGSVIKRLGERLPWWDRKIDLMVLTHPHEDHVAGLVKVLENYRVGKIVYAGTPDDNPTYAAWAALIREKRIPTFIVREPQEIDLGGGCRLEVLNRPGSGGQLNDDSLVLKLVYGRTSFLFMGDAGQEVERQLDPAELKADVLKIGHHGSDSSSGENFLKEVSPALAVIEVGRDNKFGHPSRRTLKKLERLGARVFRTDQDGTIVLRSDGLKVSD